MPSSCIFSVCFTTQIQRKQLKRNLSSCWTRHFSGQYTEEKRERKKKNDWRSENGTDAWTRSEKIRKTHTNTLLFSCHVAADSLSAIVVHKYSSRLLVCVTGLCMVKAGNGKAARQSDSSQTPFKRIVKKKVQFSLVWLLVKRTQHNRHTHRVRERHTSFQHSTYSNISNTFFQYTRKKNLYRAYSFANPGFSTTTIRPRTPNNHSLSSAHIFWSAFRVYEWYCFFISGKCVSARSRRALVYVRRKECVCVCMTDLCLRSAATLSIYSASNHHPERSYILRESLQHNKTTKKTAATFNNFLLDSNLFGSMQYSIFGDNFL